MKIKKTKEEMNKELREYELNLDIKYFVNDLIENAISAMYKVMARTALSENKFDSLNEEIKIQLISKLITKLKRKDNN